MAAQGRPHGVALEREEALAEGGVVAAQRRAREGVGVGWRLEQAVELADHEIDCDARSHPALGEARPQRLGLRVRVARAALRTARAPARAGPLYPPAAPSPCRRRPRASRSAFGSRATARSGRRGARRRPRGGSSRGRRRGARAPCRARRARCRAAPRATRRAAPRARPRPRANRRAGGRASCPVGAAAPPRRAARRGRPQRTRRRSRARVRPAQWCRARDGRRERARERARAARDGPWARMLRRVGRRGSERLEPVRLDLEREVQQVVEVLDRVRERELGDLALVEVLRAAPRRWRRSTFGAASPPRRRRARRARAR